METGAVDTYAAGPLNWAGYFIDKYFTGFQLKTWEDDLRYILRDVQENVDARAVEGSNPQYNVVKGEWDPQTPSQSYILNNVCQSTSCN